MSKKLPNLIIIGVHKSGTTSLYTYLTAHPEVYGPGKKEIHYFTPLRYSKPIADISEYESHYRDADGEKYMLDASPSYVYGGKTIIDKMREVLPEHKVIVVLRNPADRFLSYYNFLKAKFFLTADDTLEEFLEKSISQSGSAMVDNEYSRAIREGLYIDYLPEWVGAYGDNFKIIYTEELGNRPVEVMCDIAAWLNIDSTFFTTMQYTTENKTIYVKNKLIHSMVLNINHRFERFWRKNHGLKTKLRSLYYSINKKDKKMPEEQATIQNLKNYYKTPNEQLCYYLKSKGLNLPTWL